jgi:hypothetical protein
MAIVDAVRQGHLRNTVTIVPYRVRTKAQCLQNQKRQAKFGRDGVFVSACSRNTARRCWYTPSESFAIQNLVDTLDLTSESKVAVCLAQLHFCNTAVNQNRPYSMDQCKIRAVPSWTAAGQRPEMDGVCCTRFLPSATAAANALHLATI